MNSYTRNFVRQTPEVKAQTAVSVNSAIIKGVMFSMDRAMQAEAALRSLLRRCGDFERLHLSVLYRVSSPQHRRQYQALQSEFAGHPTIRWVEQGDFRQDVLRLLAGEASLDPAGRLLARIGPRLPFPVLRTLPVDKDHFVLFLVDDNLFVSDFRFDPAAQALTARPHAIGFSLRLGRNTTFCYPSNRPQTLPEFQDAGPGVLAFDWTRADADFAYPLEVSSSLFRWRDIISILLKGRFHNPNLLESRMTVRRSAYREAQPELLCFERSVTFCNPINKVQTIYPDNRAGAAADWSAASLAERFDHGERIDLSRLEGFIPHACHEEIEPSFTLADRIKNG
jgi:hypothetical protein